MKNEQSKRQKLTAYLDAFILEAVKQYAQDEHKPQPQTLEAAAFFMWSLFMEEVGRWYKGNLQDAFIYWALGGSLGTIEQATQPAADILHDCGYYSTPEKEANAAEYLHIQLSMRIRRLLAKREGFYL